MLKVNSVAKMKEISDVCTIPRNASFFPFFENYDLQQQEYGGRRDFKEKVGVVVVHAK